jgi:ABC-2 type transport system permease protein
VPKSVFAVSAIGTGLVNLVLSLILLRLPWAWCQAPGIAGAALLRLTALHLRSRHRSFWQQPVFFADMIHVYEVILTIWFYATPIIYPVDILPNSWRCSG